MLNVLCGITQKVMTKGDIEYPAREVQAMANRKHVGKVFRKRSKDSGVIDR